MRMTARTNRICRRYRRKRPNLTEEELSDSTKELFDDSEEEPNIVQGRLFDVNAASSPSEDLQELQYAREDTTTPSPPRIADASPAVSEILVKPRERETQWDNVYTADHVSNAKF
jgi:hypothetical protein